MLKNMIQKILKGDIPAPTIPQWIAGFGAIVIIRAFFEMNANPQNSMIAIENSSRVHYAIFFALIMFLFSLTVSVFAKQKGNTVINLALYGLPIIFIAPITDIILSGGAGAHMSFIFDTGSKLLNDYLTFGGTNNGASRGMQIEVLLILITIGWYVWMKRKNIFASVGAMIVSYSLLFVVAALPSVLYATSLFIQGGAPESYSYSFIENAVASSNIPSNILTQALSYASYDRLITLGTTALFSQALYILLFLAALAWFWYAHKKTFNVVLGNTRITRVLFGLSLLWLGMYLAHVAFSVAFTWVDWMGVIVLGLSWFSACMYATHVNDIADIEIDKVSNPGRPLPNGEISIEEMRGVGFVWLTASLVGAYIVGYYALLMSTVFTSAYYIYSTPPLRLKRIPLLSSFLISLAVLSTFLAGFYFASPNKALTAFPVLFSFGILIIFTLGVNIRDIKDVDGDRKAGIQTIPVIFPRYGKHIVGALFAIAALLFPFFLPFFTNYAIAIPTAILGYYFSVREPYHESYIFMLFFAFCVLSIFLK